jgi:tetratricopeptide (TPR) repeat protein
MARSCSHWLLITVVLLAGCASPPMVNPHDELPMYGQPEIVRSDGERKGDDLFIGMAMAGFAGSRKAASIAWAKEAGKHLNGMDYDYAMRRYNEAWLLDPENYLAYWGFGRLALQANRFDLSVGFLEKALAMCADPIQRPAVLSDLGTAYSIRASEIPASTPEERRGDFALANRAFQESTTLNDHWGPIWTSWAKSLAREGKYADAWTKVRKARSLGAHMPETFLNDLRAKLAEPKS